jgi:hypothetical protein
MFNNIGLQVNANKNKNEISIPLSEWPHFFKVMITSSVGKDIKKLDHFTYYR